MHKKNLQIVFTFLIALLFISTARANTIQHCDSLIKKGVEYMWKKEHVKSLELLTQARNLAEKNHWYEQVFLATNNIGANYFTMLDYGEALNYYLESYTIAVKELDPQHEMVVLNNIAIIYTKENNFEKAEEYFKKAYEIAKENKDKIKIGLYAMNLGGVANETNRPEEAKKYITESLPLLKGDPNLYVLAQITMAENDLLTGHTTQAREKALNLYASSKNLDFNDIGISLLFIITKSYLAEGKYDEAAVSGKNILAENPNTETKKTTYELLSKIYSKLKLYDKALQYKDSVLSAETELNDIKNGKLLETNKVKFEIQNYRNEIAINEEKLKTERKTFYTIIAAIMAIVTIIILLLRNLSVKLKQKKLIAEQKEQAIALELEKEKNENLILEKQIREKENKAKLEQERLKNEIESRNRKLTAKALYLSGRNVLIEDILTSLSKIPELSKNSSLTKHIKTLREHLKSDDEWENFITHFEEVNQGYITRLKTSHPSLTSNDIRFICYLYMNLTSKEIASMLNITLEACRKRKERIATKLELSDASQLYDYLYTI
ncbi:TPR domain protein [Flavobacterium beibuense]|uniref:TPR domain protein n=2 Tax=Flavobacterium beibuense TaxID=657326 RepID=A0A444W6X5_9FLAO|nr:TPR domain protein [Flavobacterium beibuense]